MKKLIKILTSCMLILIVAVTFASCGLLSLNLDKVENRLEKKDYTVYTHFDEDDEVEYKYQLSAVDEDGDFFNAFEYKTVADAKDALDELENSSIDDRVVLNRKGKVVYYGTAKGVKDALGFPASLFVK